MLLSIHVCRKLAVVSLIFSSLVLHSSGLQAQGKTYGLLKKLSGKELSADDIKEFEELNDAWKKGTIKGRDHD